MVGRIQLSAAIARRRRQRPVAAPNADIPQKGREESSPLLYHKQSFNKEYVMKTFWRTKLALFIGFLASILISVNCHLWGTEAAITFTTAEIESMAKRVAPAVGIAGPDPELPRVF